MAFEARLGGWDIAGWHPGGMGGFFDPCVEEGDATITVTEDTTVTNESVT